MISFGERLLCLVGDKEKFRDSETGQELLTSVIPQAISNQQTNTAKAGVGPETAICLDNHSRELSEVHKPPLRSNSKSQSVKDYRVPENWLCPINLRTEKSLPPAFPPHFPPSWLCLASACPSGVRILWLPPPLWATQTDLLCQGLQPQTITRDRWNRSIF